MELILFRSILEKLKIQSGTFENKNIINLLFDLYEIAQKEFQEKLNQYSQDQR